MVFQDARQFFGCHIRKEMQYEVDKNEPKEVVIMNGKVWENGFEHDNTKNKYKYIRYGMYEKIFQPFSCVFPSIHLNKKIAQIMNDE
jgi:hypothetical protein